jgi:hypothetical protein
MPLNINVGLSRKASRDFQSTGYSINLVAELDSALLAHPDELQEQIADLYTTMPPHSYEGNSVSSSPAPSSAIARPNCVAGPPERGEALYRAVAAEVKFVHCS